MQDASKPFQDSNGRQEWTTGGAAKHYNKCKNISAKHNFVMSVLESGVIRVVSVRAKEVKADFLTKPASPTGLDSAITVLNIFSHPTPNC